jgi:hypothetical protein
VYVCICGEKFKETTTLRNHIAVNHVTCDRERYIGRRQEIEINRQIAKIFIRCKGVMDYMSSVSKGRKAEKECREELKKMNYKTFSPQKTSFYGTQDILGKFDVLAVNPNLGSIRFIQVKKSSTHGFLKVLRAWANEYKNCQCTWELWVRLDTRKNPEKWHKYMFRGGKEISD